MATQTATAARPEFTTKFLPSGSFSLKTDFTATVNSSDVMQLVKVPSGFKVEEVVLQLALTRETADGSITVNFRLGDPSSSARFISSSIQVSATAATSVVNRLGSGILTRVISHKYNADSTIDLSILSITGTASANALLQMGLVVLGSIDS